MITYKPKKHQKKDISSLDPKPNVNNTSDHYEITLNSNQNSMTESFFCSYFQK